MSEPIHIISLGAGVQSSTMALMAAHGEITPMPKCAIFADTQAEPPSVYKWLSWLCGVEVKYRMVNGSRQPYVESGDYQSGILPYRVSIQSKGSLTKSITTLRNRKDGNGYWIYSGIPTFNVNPDGSDGHVQRQCTSSFKVEVIDKATRREAAIKRGQKTIGAINWIGISLDEVHRMKTARHPWQQFRYPLIDLRMNRNDCLLWMQRNGYPKPPRSACVYCPYHSDAEWRRLREEEPEAFAEAVRVDKVYRQLKMKSGFGVTKQRGIPYIHNSRKPLDQVDFSTDEDHGQQVMFGNDCEGMCGV